jgi:hypothetical protein
VTRACLCAGVGALALLVCGCGGIKSPDLFVVKRTGEGPNARLTMLVDEEGGVRCNGGPERKLSDPQIVKSRAITEELEHPAAHHLVLAPQPGSVLRYEVRDEAGTVRFADNSRAQPAVLRQLALFVLQTAQQVCHLPE